MAITSATFARPRAVARAVARRTPVNMDLARIQARSAQPTGAFIARLTVTAVFAYLLALFQPGSARSMLAPLTAVLVVQATLYRTVHSAVQRVVSVVAGVLVALALSAALGFTWWSLGLTIAAALAIGSVLRLGDHVLEVPISAMLILSLDSRAAATGRIVDTLVGAAAGLLGGLLLSSVRTQPAEDAIGNLSRQMADLLEEIALGLAEGSVPGEAEAWLVRARALAGEVQRVEDALGEAEDSLRLRPPKLRSARTAVPLRNGLETLEHAAVTIRGLTRSITDDARLPDGEAATLAADTPDLLAEVLRQLAAAVRTYGGLVRADLTAGRIPDGSELDRHLAEARQQQDRLAPALHNEPGVGPASWRLRGELLVHLDRLTSELQAEHLGRDREESGYPPWLQTVRADWPRSARELDHVGAGAWGDRQQRGRLRDQGARPAIYAGE